MPLPKQRETDVIKPDRREFGRRRACMHVSIYSRTLPRIPCILRNISIGGALLETDWAPRLPDRFMLHIESWDETLNCEVRHRTPTAVGVLFVNPDDVEAI